MRQHQSGVTIIELMVSLAVSLFLILVIAQFFVANKAAFRTQQAQADMQERGRFALLWVGQQVRQAGYVDSTRIATAKATNFAAAGGMGAEVVLQGSSTALSYRFYGAADGDLIDCQGGAASAGVLVSSTIATSGTSLTCGGSEVLPGVQQLVFQYGVDTDSDRIPDVYQSNSNSSQVYAVRACVMLRSLQDNVTTTQQTLSDCSGANVAISSGGLAKVFRTSVYLRNN